MVLITNGEKNIANVWCFSPRISYFNTYKIRLMNIPLELIPLAYELSKKVNDGKLTNEEGIDRLSGNNRMNKGSASIYITVFQQLMQGEKITFTLNAPSIEYCLEQIRKDYGLQKFSVALSSLKQHIEYCQDKNRSNMDKLKTVYEKYSRNT